MPYADPEKQRAAKAKWYRAKCAKDAAFRKAERERKAAWLQTDLGRELNRIASLADWRSRVEPEKVRGEKSARERLV